jgi:hypothetical protein
MVASETGAAEGKKRKSLWEVNVIVAKKAADRTRLGIRSPKSRLIAGTSVERNRPRTGSTQDAPIHSSHAHNMSLHFTQDLDNLH